MKMKTRAFFSIFLVVFFMGCCVSGAHIEFEEDFEEFGNIEQEMGVQNDSIQGRGEEENNEGELGSHLRPEKSFNDKQEMDQGEHEQSKRVDPGTVIAATQLTLDTLTKLLDTIASVGRKIAIGFDNETPYKWQALNTYFYSGTSDTILPKFVQRKEAGLYTARKTKGPVARGSVGVFTYYVPSVGKTIAVMFSVPFNYHWYSNWWDVKVYPGKKRADYNMWYDMYYGNPFKGDDGWHEKAIGEGFRVEGIMTSAGESRMELDIYK